jgi:hypothetical protein
MKIKSGKIERIP